jgi:hypothetical protein
MFVLRACRVERTCFVDDLNLPVFAIQIIVETPMLSTHLLTFFHFTKVELIWILINQFTINAQKIQFSIADY